MKCAIVYTSITGNTKVLAEELYQIFLDHSVDIRIYRIEEFPIIELCKLDGAAIGTYTWGQGDIPKEMRGLYQAIESLGKKDMITGVFGTGDSCYPNYCGAVDQFRDMLYVHSTLATTLKVELSPQIQDIERCQMFVESMLKRANSQKMTS